MRLSSDLITEFQKVHREVFHEPISAETAELELLSLAELIRNTQPTKNMENEYEIETKSHDSPIGAAR